MLMMLMMTSSFHGNMHLFLQCVLDYVKYGKKYTSSHILYYNIAIYLIIFLHVFILSSWINDLYTVD